MKKYLLFLMSALSLGLLSACNNDDESTPTLLYNQWVLVSYVNETGEVLKEAKGYYYLITFYPDGTYFGQAYGNEMGGEYTFIGNTIKISYPDITKRFVVGADQDEFFLEHLHDVYTYRISASELRLYYSKDQYFKFRIKENKL